VVSRAPKEDLDGKAIPVFIVALVLLARGVYLACRVNKSWCLRAVKHVGQQIGKYSGRASRWIGTQTRAFVTSKRVRDAVKCANHTATLVQRVGGRLPEPEVLPRSRLRHRLHGWILIRLCPQYQLPPEG
jgi:hypothetical protein